MMVRDGIREANRKPGDRPPEPLAWSMVDWLALAAIAIILAVILAGCSPPFPRDAFP